MAESEDSKLNASLEAQEESENIQKSGTKDIEKRSGKMNKTGLHCYRGG